MSTDDQKLPRGMQTPAMNLLAGLAAQVNPRKGDQFTFSSDHGNPFSSTWIEVLEVRDGWVLYSVCPSRFSNIKAPSSCDLTTFGLTYEPTKETVAARKHGITLPDYLAYLEDMRQQAEDEAKQIEEQEAKDAEYRDKIRGDADVARDVEREAAEFRHRNPQD